MSMRIFLAGSLTFSRENNPKLAVEGDRRRGTLIIRLPQVLREGPKKTVRVSFRDHCKAMHRQADHVMAFLLAEAGTTGSLMHSKDWSKTLEDYCGDMPMNMLFAIGAKVLTLCFQRRIVSCFSDARSAPSVAPIKPGFESRVGPRN